MDDAKQWPPAGVKWYYSDDAVAIAHGDCREILPELPQVDLVLTDPPYNCGKDYGAYKDNLLISEYHDFMKEIVKITQDMASNHFWVAPRYQMAFFTTLMPEAHLIVIRRGASGPYRQGWADQFQTALVIGRPCSVTPDLWDDIRLKGEGYYFKEETYGHPGYTPYKIMARAIKLLSNCTVLDPFVGTGTALVAAKNQNKKAIGIEIEEKYCEIAANRCRQMVMPLGV